MHLRRGSRAHRRGGSMGSVGSSLDAEDQEGNEGSSEWNFHPQPQNGKHRTVANNYYKLVIRCGSGWMAARDYFSKLHFTNLHTQSCLNAARDDHGRSLDEVLATRSLTLGDSPYKKDTIPIQPLFHPFLRLPPELQELILLTSTSLFGTYNMCHDTQLFPQPNPTSQSPISLSTLLRISPHITHTLHPYILASTNFHFGLTGFTNFLWQLGPSSRSQLQHLTFHFGKMAILHCIRWLAPDYVFELFEPPVVTDPRSLQYFWRCQVRDLAKEVHLSTLTIDVRGMAADSLPLVTRCVREIFGSVERVRFVETQSDGKVDVLGDEDERVVLAKRGVGWRVGCKRYFERYRRYQYFMRFELLGSEMEVMERRMVGWEWDE
ncbi:hypothetical protein NX059_005543 [Plenodomus lindquistii]|nr:hypothetical protein NX059_005543 [Plenodomus lindquistii]